MTLTSPLHLVKRHSKAVALALGIALAVTGGLAFIWHDHIADDARAESYGINLASTLAAQGMEAIIQPDTLHLSVLVNRMVALPAVSDARYLDANNNMLVGNLQAADPDQPTFSAPIRIGGAISGYAEVSLVEGAFRPEPTAQQIVATILLVLCMPVLTMMIGEWPVRRSRPVPVVEFPEDLQPAGPTWLVVVNLYNQLSYPSEQRREILNATRDSAQQVAQFYQGEARSVTGTGVAIEFHDIDDAAFKAVCASFVLLKVLAQNHPDGQYRIALHRLEDASNRSETIADLALLAALTKEGAISVTAPFHHSLQRPERLTAELFEHTMLDDVTTIGETAWLITDLDAKHNALLQQQADAVVGYSTPRASTL